MRILLKNSKIYDGTGTSPYFGDILVEDDRILRIGQDLTPEADRILDLQGLSVAPGFIDAHSHNDWFAIKQDPLPYFEPFVRQGITTYVTGNCGLSAVGFGEDCPHMDKLGAGLFSFQNTTGRYSSAAEYFAAMDGKAPGNIALLAGHCTARAAVSGSANRPLTPEEETQMLALLEKQLQQGAAGISLGLMYDPGIYSQLEELKKVAALCIKYDRPLTVHTRANSAVSMAYPELLGRSHLLRAMDEMVQLVGDTKLKLQCSHAIFVGRRSFRDKDEFIKLIDAMRAGGADVMFDIYNEMMGVSVITVILPVWYQAMTPEERRKPLTRLKLSLLIKASSLLLGFGFKDIQVAYIGKGYEQYEGKSVHQIAKEAGISNLKAYLMLCEQSDFKGRVNMGPYTTPEIIEEFSKNQHCLFMTDAWVEDQGIQNPGIYDCFPKFLRDSLLGKGDSLPGAVRRMTGATADRFGLKARGYLKEGFFADITVFDEEALKTATPDQGKSFGIPTVMLGGKLVMENGVLNEDLLRTAGRAIPVE